MGKLFGYADENSNIRTEILAGITTFLTTMYIIVVNPSILSAAGMPFNGVLTATALVSAFSSILMGLYAKNPIVVAPGMGLNAFFAYTMVQGMGIAWQQALGAVFWAGVIFLLLSLLNIRTRFVLAIPHQLRYGLAAGIGLFITLIGFKNAGFITSNQVTVIGRGALDAVSLTFLLGLALSALLVARQIKGALIFGIVATTLAALPIGRLYGDASAINFGNATLVSWQGLVSMPDFSLVLQLDLAGSLNLSFIPVLFTLLFTDMFDSISTFMGVAEAGSLTDSKGNPRNIRESMIVDAVATTFSGLVGSSPGTAYIESATGIAQGGRTGLTAVVAGVLFLPFIFLSPLLSVVPAIATAPALVLVGVFMMEPVVKIRWKHYEDSIPAFLAMILMPLSFSITQGIVWGFLSWTILQLFSGKRDSISPALLVIDLFAILALVAE